MSTEEFDRMIEALHLTGRFRVLRKLETCLTAPHDAAIERRRGLFVDVETTGLDHGRDEVIELAMIPFTYGIDGRIFEVGEAFHGYRQPTIPIPPKITELTGIDDAMVAGHALDVAAIDARVGEVDLVLAHNAAFDRKFLERLSETFVRKPWACSMSQVDWNAEGFEGTKLGYLAMGAGFFYDRHRATNDCLAALHLLSLDLPKSRRPALAQLLERARRPSWRIWAENAPYDFKDILKARGYRWNGEVNGFPRAWYRDVEDDQRDAEIDYLRSEIYQKRDFEPHVRKVSAFERFSVRC